ncbi:MAG: hypothetical protein OQJ93_00390 [Ignavibacteriaceae bacterium]|jgi:hypothetical protein|nr:hypothetical protein [Ignavibacteriaceae bacterium]MCW8813357.1 hypothetical protein [Chlorobium sp.]MCW8818250.1 hypothetical protein [Ignavibacteriaceae bacterium]MCW8822450.1 hypothetical protein [Ignavibacteriaceae bacterium]MCW8960144.1 hypothetical protein [Ignavibacteriaceae bacterium]
MRNFEVTVTYKASLINQIQARNIIINRQKILDVVLDDSHCLSPEEFCDSVINLQERPNVVRINVKEKNTGNVKPLHWINEHSGRIYLLNGIPLILNKN